jgi:hypothetical protein
MTPIAAGIAIALALPHPSYAATPQQAALDAVYASRSAVVVRTNVVGRFATVLLRGAKLEGAPVDEPILLERFSFGWQPLDIVNFPCRLLTHAIPPRDTQRLMLGMPRLRTQPPGRVCNEDDNDVGPAPQTEAVRRLMQGPLTPTVVVAGDYALGQWYGAGGGQSLFVLRAGSWHRLTGGGGALGVSEMRRYHVPQSAWCTFRIYNAACKV